VKKLGSMGGAIEAGDQGDGLPLLWDARPRHSKNRAENAGQVAALKAGNKGGSNSSGAEFVAFKSVSEGVRSSSESIEKTLRWWRVFSPG
jgi:hypothetical protein